MEERIVKLCGDPIPAPLRNQFLKLHDREAYQKAHYQMKWEFLVIEGHGVHPETKKPMTIGERRKLELVARCVATQHPLYNYYGLRGIDEVSLTASYLNDRPKGNDWYLWRKDKKKGYTEANTTWKKGTTDLLNIPNKCRSYYRFCLRRLGV